MRRDILDGGWGPLPTASSERFPNSSGEFYSSVSNPSAVRITENISSCAPGIAGPSGTSIAMESLMQKKTALVVGASGIVGLNLATLLSKKDDWTVYGLSRKPTAREGILPVAADL